MTEGENDVYTSAELVKLFWPKLTPRKIELWVNKGLIEPTERGGRGRSRTHRFQRREVRKIQYMLEALEKSRSPEDAKLAAEEQLANDEKPAVLIVDPDLIARSLLAASLDSSYRVFPTDSIHRALGLVQLEDSKFDVVVAEPKRADEDCLHLGQILEGKGIPLIIVSCADEPPRLNYRLFLRKPISPDEIATAMKAALGSGGYGREAEGSRAGERH